MSKKTKYLENLNKVVDEEFFIIENAEDYDVIEQINELKEMWIKNRSIDELRMKTDELSDNFPLAFVVPEITSEEDDRVTIQQIALMRLFVFFNILNDTLDALMSIEKDDIYQKLVYRYPDKDIDFAEFAAITKVAKDHVAQMTDSLKVLSIPDSMHFFLEHLKTIVVEMNQEKDLAKFYEDLYDFFDYTNVFLDQIEGEIFDWDEDEITQANFLFFWLFTSELVAYNLLLLKEYYLELQQPKVMNQQLQEIKYITDNRQEMVNEFKILLSLDKAFENNKK
ncbi:hypothetical protein [Mesoplasma lactucae]|uniref:Uncharacterized protein n=1 Tax=Mesoplasma lactucae ATCC 49193 TaxID=81460 RepID=A0A291IRU8_9MOLU|nr:hypothetical protein [Mesoplasma lactucae]ATG97582.1 hypothetical protein CP520_02345 [Mesoplasma lactucae ATCC 49193]ATZ19959.1 hypothetical protein MLACT_v1c01370 [Mesoplasma lactucae ATCC 49193]MCL8217090.1 hypothetical protein [Mesoplasma lactucae ATCC 49193]